jgi:hypothetical protein
MATPIRQWIRSFLCACSAVASGLLAKAVSSGVLSERALLEHTDHRLRKAIARGDVRTVSKIMEQGLWSPNKTFIDHIPLEEGVRFQRGYTPLHVASAAGQFEVIELLLSLGAHARSKTNWNITPMHVAAHGKHAHIVAELADAGGDPLDCFPCLSNYAEDDPYCPTSIQILQGRGVEYVGDENRRYRAERDHALLSQEGTRSLVAVSSRPRL